MTRSIDVKLHNNVAEIALVRDALDDLGCELDIPPRALMQLQVALDEIVSNVVKYSWDDDGRHEFLVKIKAQPGRIDLEVLDDGRAFDPLAAPPPRAVPRGGRPQPGGLGIHMVKQLVDHLAYERIGGHNRTSFSKAWEVGAVQGRDK